MITDIQVGFSPVNTICGGAPSVTFVFTGTADLPVNLFTISGGGLDGDRGFYFDDVQVTDDTFVATVVTCSAPTFYNAVDFSFQVSDVSGALSSVYAFNETFYTPGCPSFVIDDGETCDDGNTVSGDGCDASCQLEVDVSTCEAVAPIALPYSATFDTIAALSEFPDSCGGTVLAGGSETYIPIVVPALSVLLIDIDADSDFSFSFGEGCARTIGGSCFGSLSGLAGVHRSTTFSNSRPEPVSTILLLDLLGPADVATFTISIEAAPLDECGNRLLDDGESCDDGNSVSGDGCDATCQVEIDVSTCEAVASITLPYNETFDTTGALSEFSETCGGTVQAAGSETYLPIVIPPFSVLLMDVDANADFSIAAGEDCARSLGSFCLGSLSSLAGVTLSTWFTNNGSEPESVVFILDLLAPVGGATFTVNLETAPVFTCGNHPLDNGEECDDGNLIDGDGCSSTCAVEPPTTTITGVQVSYTVADFRCGGNEPSVTFTVTGTSDAEVSSLTIAGGPFGDPVTVDFIDENADPNIFVGAVTYCRNPNQFNGVDLVFQVEDSIYEFNETFYTPSCPNLIIDDGETCDDGNSNPGDGCDASCTVEQPPFITDVQGSFTAIDLGCGDQPSVTFTFTGTADSQISSFIVSGGPFGLATANYTFGDMVVDANGFVGSTSFCANPGLFNSVDITFQVIDAAGVLSNEFTFSEATFYTPQCPNDIIDDGESCDDGNIVPGDGCDASCQVEIDVSTCEAVPFVTLP